uniref:Zinc finger protein 142 n=1 Tax=Iconisemion striatum TaxID=60296 RepID=A0A1A7X5V9_9TELE
MMETQGPAAPCSKHVFDSYKCSQCNQVFSKQLDLKKHFKTEHKDHESRDSFTCLERHCQFSSLDHQDYRDHLASIHGLKLIPCSTRSCKSSFLTQGDMEKHRRSHMPFGCFQCQFVSNNAKNMKVHLLEHNHQENNPGNENESTARKRLRASVENDISSSPAAGPLPSKEYLAEGTEETYRTHTCPKCRRCFKMRSHLQEHLRLHFPDPSLQCPTCNRFFTSKSKLRLHRLREAGEKTHRCHLCDYSAVERNAIRRHVASMHSGDSEDTMNSQSFLCPTCSQSFHQSRALKAHMKTHNVPSDNTPLACFQEGCSFQSSVRRDLLKHASEVHKIKAAECRHHACGAVFRSQEDMEAHYRTHLAYHCSDCRFTCSNKSLFLQHQRLGHSGNEKLCCGFCPFVTFNPVEFEQHVGHLHANEKIHRCSQCSFVTSHKRGLKRHVLMHSSEKPHKCSLCDFRCRDESYLSKHMLTHEGEKNFMCAECGYVTRWKHYLTVHMRKHAGDLRYSCDQCSYRCHRMDQLKSHKLRHQAKSLICEICAYACKRKYELRNHMLAKHCGQKKLAAFRCKYCTYTTCYRQALQNHENCKHTKLKEFHCALCVYSSFSSISLFLHKRKAHGYVPGDKAWLENYAAREKERSSAEFMQDFYVKSYVARELSEQPACGSETPEAQFISAASFRAGDSVFDGSQEVVNETASDQSEQYCTLVLTTLTTAEDQTEVLQTEDKNCKSDSSLDSHRPESQERSDPSAPASLLEEENMQSEESTEDQTHEVENNEQSQLSEPEVRLKALKEHDKEQAEAMVLEGRVQMLVVPSEEVYRCDKCSYVTCKQTALRHHRGASCIGRIKGHKCQACGVEFKQRRGLEFHLKKKCPALPRKTRTFTGVSNPHLTSRETSASGSEHVDGGRCSDQTEQVSTEHPPTPTVSGVLLQRKRLYVKAGGRFRCQLCSFSSLQLRTFRRHLSTCRRKNPEHVDEIDEHLQCQLCVFNCKQQSSMKQHLSLKHKGSGPHRCRFCPFDTTRRYRLEEHESLHKGVGRHSCDTCNKTFGAMSKLRQHKKRVHDKPPLHSCSRCDFRGRTPDDVRRHERRCHTGELQHICTHCDSCFSSEIALRNHCKRVHQLQARFSCKKCDFTCSSDVVLKNHQLDRHPEVKCTTCQGSFETKESLEVHHRTHLPHQCQRCRFAAKTRQLLVQHLLSEHEEGPPEDKPLKCSACQFACRHQLVLEQHLRSHGTKRLYKCTDCKYETRNKQKITWHIRIHTGEKPYGCERCSYACSDPFRLKLHMRVHQEEKKYLCPECGYKCKWATQLKYHMTKHTGEKPYACDECEYRTNRADALRVHRDTQHCETRPYICEKCGKAFKTSFVLKTHQRKHSDDRPYACGLCQKSFRWPAGLRHHYLSHIKQQPFRCHHCSYRAKQKFQVVKHLRRHHPEASVELGVVRDPEGGGLTLKEALLGMLREEASGPTNEGEDVPERVAAT